MYDLLSSRFSYSSIKFDGNVAFCMVVVWFMVLVCSLISLWGQGWSRRRTLLWAVAIICLPGVGVLAYLPFSWKTSNALRFTFPRWPW
jgi:hypothetical protein